MPGERKVYAGSELQGLAEGSELPIEADVMTLNAHTAALSQFLELVRCWGSNRQAGCWQLREDYGLGECTTAA